MGCKEEKEEMVSGQCDRQNLKRVILEVDKHRGMVKCKTSVGIKYARSNMSWLRFVLTYCEVNWGIF
jgi:hypothetical protein